jgi:hypothetical protein
MRQFLPFGRQKSDGFLPAVRWELLVGSLAARLSGLRGRRRG